MFKRDETTSQNGTPNLWLWKMIVYHWWFLGGPSHPRTDDGSIESGDCVRIQINVLDL